MSPLEIEKIRYRNFGAIKPMRRGLNLRPHAIGFDIETCDGAPYILGIEGPDFEEVREIGPGEGLPYLLRTIKKLCVNSRSVVAGAHNVRFDLGVLFWDWCNANGLEFPSTSDDMEQEIDGMRFKLWIGPLSFATLSWGHKMVQIIDTFAYFKSSLVKAVKALGLGETKADFPGRNEDPEWFMRKFPLEEIGPYCLQDSHLAKLLVNQVIDWWMSFGIRPCISGPQMAGRVLCKAFVQRPWIDVPDTAKALSLFSYHGGRNFYRGEPRWYEHLYAYDINSAYTWAMTQMPDMTEGEWQAGAGNPEPGSWGFVVLQGILPKLEYPVIYRDDFTPYQGGELIDGAQAITSMEWDLLHELAPEWEPDSIGWVRWIPARQGMSDLGNYAVEMWRRRAQSTTDVEKTLYKFLSNSLYGKFIARSPNEDGTKYAGQLFYPPIASWITALVRTKVIRIEFQYKVLHTATDGVMTHETMPSSNELGAFKLENEGPALILRNKLYLHWDRSGRLKKMATHGFQGNLSLLLTLIREGRTSYARKRLRGWKEARRSRERPFAPLAMEMALNVDEAPWKRIVEQSSVEPFRSLLVPE